MQHVMLYMIGLLCTISVYVMPVYTASAVSAHAVPVHGMSAFIRESHVGMYNEQLGFDGEGNLIMITHDKKASTYITYKTLGFVIKRYDMPREAAYQQYAVIAIGSRGEILEDIFDSSYVYCRYCIEEAVIADAVRKVSEEWYRALYSYGDHVYIDEIMTIAERGQLLGGLSENLEPYGEVYSDYEGIASARPWASKESLKTHFNKQVYFTARVIPKTFRYDEKVTAGRELSNDRAGTIHISAGTRYRADYDVSEAVPTGEPLCINGLADSFKYKIVFDKVQIDFYIPVKLIVNYDIEWKGYDGGDRAEKKSITKWYYVKRTVSYYTLKQLDLSYLTAIAVSNYAFEGNGIRENIQGCRPSIDSQRYGAYYYHVTFPEYEDVLYVDGGELKENVRYGVKPVIPDEDFQRIADNSIGAMEVKSDRLVINNRTILSDKPVKNNTGSPVEPTFTARRSLYYGGNIIPNDKRNSCNNISSGYYIYTDYESGRTYRENVSGIDSVTIHTPVYIAGGEIVSTEEESVSEGKSALKSKSDGTNTALAGHEFRIRTNHYGQHINCRGYKTRDYRWMAAHRAVKFNCEVLLGDNIVEKDTWIDFDADTVFGMPFETEEGEYEMTIRVFAGNIPSDNLSEKDYMENYVENTANLDIHHYIAQSVDTFKVEKLITEPKAEVVGTH